MNEIEIKLEELVELFKRDLPRNTTSVSVSMNCEGIEFNYRTRIASGLKLSGISMRNISGEWIEQKKESAIDEVIKCLNPKI